MARTDEQKQARKSRYKHAIQLGFSPTEARRFRDLASHNLENQVNIEARRISRKSVARRTPAERTKLERIRNSRVSSDLIQANQLKRDRRNKTKNSRARDFSNWSSTGFPAEALERIRAYNRAKGLSRDAKFGYRRFWWWYVARIADFENEMFADRGDSSIRARPLTPNSPIVRQDRRIA